MRTHFRHLSSKRFLRHKELFNPMSFNPWNCFLKIRKSIRTPTLKVGIHLGVWGFIPPHSPTLPGIWNVTPRLHSLTHILASPCLGRKPKAKIMTFIRCIRKCLKSLWFIFYWFMLWHGWKHFNLMQPLKVLTFLWCGIILERKNTWTNFFFCGILF